MNENTKEAAKRALPLEPALQWSSPIRHGTALAGRLYTAF